MASYIRNAAFQTVELWNLVNKPPYKEIDSYLARVENHLNKAGWIPGISMVSGQLREYLGYIELTMGAAAGCVHTIASQFTKDAEAKKRLYKQAESDCSYCKHGLVNIVRGNIEKIPAWDVWALLINKLVLFSCDAFGLRINYEYEKMPAGKIPMFPSIEKM